MKKILLLLLMLGTFTAFAQEIRPLVIGELHTLESKVLAETRTLNMYLPPKYDAAKAYPIVYLLDGSMNEDFLHLTGLFQFFNMQLKMPDCIVVGIANIDRKRDFTFPTNIPDLKKDYPTTGHSQKFIQFLETELQPYLERNYKTNGTRYLVGQSLGGLLACEILLKKPQLFTHYFIVSPSLWWDDQSLLTQTETLWKAQQERDLFVYIAVGGGEHKVMKRDAEQFYRILEKNKRKKLQLFFNLMPKENHATILHQSIYDGLLKLFPYKE